MQGKKQTSLYAKKLVCWYDNNFRIMPWRITPYHQNQGLTAKAYHVWLSEIMLQQTTVAAVKPYFEKFIQLWPNLTALSKASLDDILKAWAGLGYYSRARNLKKCADLLVAEYDGHFPKTAEELQKLPGIGPYTSAAIAAIAFNEACAVIDANVERVISRLFYITTPLPAAKKEIRDACNKIVPKSRPGDFAQAMMDLGATLCSIKSPNCQKCPLNTLCYAYLKKDVERLPLKVPKAKKEERFGIAYVALNNNEEVYLQKRPEAGLLGGMSEVPNQFVAIEKNNAKITKNQALTNLKSQPFEAEWLYQGEITHVFTHFRLTLSVYKAYNIIIETHNDNSEKDKLTGFWVKQESLTKQALPTVMKKAIKCALPTCF